MGNKLTDTMASDMSEEAAFNKNLDRKRKYCPEWEREPELKDWLQPVPGEPCKAFCRFCQQYIRAHHTDIMIHSSTRKHHKNSLPFIDSAGLEDGEEEDLNMSDDRANSEDSIQVLDGSFSPSFHHILTQTSLQRLARQWLKEDAPGFDCAGFVVGDQEETAVLLMKEPGVLSGRPFVDAIFKELDCSVVWTVKEGEFVVPIKTVATITGPVRNLLLGERVALNCITRSSGVATTAQTLAKLASSRGWKGKLAGTRKTTPGFRLVEKYSLLVGGVSTHRHDLSSMIMLKDNHIWTAGSVIKAVKDARLVGGFSTKIEVECRSLEEAIEAADAGADVLMLDNFSPEAAKEASARLKSHFPSLTIEVSGGITSESLLDYCLEHVDLISLGMLTQGYPSIDFSFKIVKKGHDPNNHVVTHI